MMDIQGEFHTNAIPVVGSCVAGRSWRAYPDGVLTGVTYSAPWTTTGNTAWCPFIGGEPGDTVKQPEDWRNTGYMSTFNVTKNNQVKRHAPGSLNCTCGFWCYSDLSMSETWATHMLAVVGVVNVWGVMTRGTKGYRAQHADIAALVRPEWADELGQLDMYGDRIAHPEVWDAVVDRYSVPVYSSLTDAMRSIHGRSLA